MIDAAEFEQRWGRAPEGDELERANCLTPGTVGHFYCGICLNHESPRSMCGCFPLRSFRADLNPITVAQSDEDPSHIAIGPREAQFPDVDDGRDCLSLVLEGFDFDRYMHRTITQTTVDMLRADLFAVFRQRVSDGKIIAGPRGWIMVEPLRQVGT